MRVEANLQMMKQIISLCEVEIRFQMTWVHGLANHLNRANKILLDNSILE
jgi:hypothetical protein